MQVCIGELHGKPAILELKNGVAYINDEPQPIKNLAETDLENFSEKLARLKKSGDTAADSALENSVRAAFLAELLGKAVGDDCMDLLTHLLDHAHYDVLKYLGEAEE